MDKKGEEGNGKRRKEGKEGGEKVKREEERIRSKRWG